jgi:hypothetical protein
MMNLTPHTHAQLLSMRKEIGNEILRRQARPEGPSYWECRESNEDGSPCRCAGDEDDVFKHIMVDHYGHEDEHGEHHDGGAGQEDASGAMEPIYDPI